MQDVDRGTPAAECQWWADRLGDEWEAGAPKVFFPPMRQNSHLEVFAKGGHGEAARRRGPAFAGGGFPHFR